MANQRPSGLTSAVASLLGLAVPLAVFLLTTPYLVARLGTGQYGILMLVVSLTAILGSLDFGLATGGVREISRALARGENDRLVQLLREYLSLFVVVGLTVFAALVVFARQVVSLLGMNDVIGAEEAAWVVFLLAVSLLFQLLTAWASLLPRALEQFPAIALIQVLANIAVWGGAVALLALDSGPGLLLVVIWSTFLSGLVCLAFLIFSRKLLPAFSCRPAGTFRETPGIFGYSFYAFVGQLTSAFAYHADRLLIAYFLGPEPVAYYAVAANVASKLLSLGAAMANFVFPRAVALSAAADIPALTTFYARASRYQLLVLAPLLAPAVMLSESLLAIWLGPAFAAQAAPLLQVLCFGYAVAVLSVVPSQIFNGIGNARIGALFATTGTLMNIGGCVILLPLFGMMGAAAASLLGMLQAVVYAGALEAHLGLGWFKARRGFYLSVLGVIAGQFLALYAMRPLVGGWVSLLLVGTGGYAVFYLAWRASGLLSADDKKVLGELSGLWRRKFLN